MPCQLIVYICLYEISENFFLCKTAFFVMCVKMPYDFVSSVFIIPCVVFKILYCKVLVLYQNNILIIKMCVVLKDMGTPINLRNKIELCQIQTFDKTLCRFQKCLMQTVGPSVSAKMLWTTSIG